MSTKIPPIREFPKDGRLWRIDWLGAVEQAAAEARIEVFLSPAKAGVQLPWEQKHFELDTTRTWIGVGQLPLLAIGSLWRDGRRQVGSAGMQVTLPDIRIEPSAVQLVNAGTKLTADRWLIPPFEHRLHKDTWLSQCLAIEHGGDPYGILLPVSEAIRFFYAVSTDLAHITFNGALQLHRNSVIDPAYSGMLKDQDRLVLKLRQWLADDDGWVIGRSIVDPVAGAGMARVYDSLLRSSANTRAAFPECGLPFVGLTRWGTRGIQLTAEGQASKRWLIFEIKRCSAPFPFGELEIIRDNDGRKGDPNFDLPEEEKRPAWAGPQKQAETKSDTELQSGDPPDSALGITQIPLAAERFEALLGREIIKTLKESCRYKSASFRDDVPVGSLNTSDGVSGQEDVGPAKVEWQRQVEVQRRKGLPPSFEMLLTVVEALNARPGITAQVRPSTEDIACLPATKPSRMQQWSYLDFETKAWRRVMVVDIACDGRYASLVEFELRASDHCVAALLLSSDTTAISNAILVNLFRRLVIEHGVWANITLPPGLALKGFKHTRPSAADFAVALHEAIAQVG